jgi:hypothetical protein
MNRTETVRTQNGSGTVGKGSQAHHEDAGVLGKTGEGPKLSDFAGDQRGRRGRCLLFWADRVDSSCRDDPGGKAKPMASLAGRGITPEDGAMARFGAAIPCSEEEQRASNETEKGEERRRQKGVGVLGLEHRY